MIVRCPQEPYSVAVARFEAESSRRRAGYKFIYQEPRLQDGNRVLTIDEAAEVVADFSKVWFADYREPEEVASPQESGA